MHLWIIEHRLHPGDGSVLHVSSARVKAIRWIRRYDPMPREAGYFALFDIILDEKTMCEGSGTLEFYTLRGRKLKQQPQVKR